MIVEDEDRYSFICGLQALNYDVTIKQTIAWLAGGYCVLSRILCDVY